MIYLDNAASTELCTQARLALCDALGLYANPSSLHAAGRAAAALLERSRTTLAECLDCAPDELYFTSGGTEANNIAIHGAARRHLPMLCTNGEHASVYEPAKSLNASFLHPDKLLAAATGPCFVSCIARSNETGERNHVAELAKELHSASPDSILHSDCVQAFGTIPKGADICTFSGHKIHAPKGIGLIYARRGLNLKKLTLGGAQERGLRPGTEPAALAAAFAAAAECWGSPDDSKLIESLRTQLLSGIAGIEHVRLLCAPENSHIAVISLPGIPSEVGVRLLSELGVCVGAGAACSGAKISRVLLERGFPHNLAASAIRVSFSRFNKLSDVDALIAALKHPDVLRTQLSRTH